MSGASGWSGTDGTQVERPSGVPAWVVRVLSGVWGLALVGAVTAAVPAGLVWWVGGPMALAVVLSMPGGRFGSFVPWSLVVAVFGVLAAANAGELSVPTAAVLGLLVLGYLLLVELSDALDGEGVYLSVGAVAGWVRSTTPVLAAGLVAALVVSAAVVLPVPAGPWLVVAAPVVLLAAVVVAVRRRRVRQPPEQ